MPKSENLSGQIFNNWKVNFKLEKNFYNCTCLLCNNYFKVGGYALKSGRSKACVTCANKIKETRKEKLEGSIINDWEVLEYIGDSKYKCRCKCGNIEEKHAYYLKTKSTKCCSECLSKIKSNAIREKLEGQQFGELTVTKYLGTSRYLCKCSCGKEHETSAYCLRTGISKMCLDCSGKIRKNKYRETMFSRYNDICSAKINKPREEWQLELINNKELLLKYIKEFENDLGRLPTSVELAKDLDLSVNTLLTYTREYNISLYRENVSTAELEIRNILDGMDMRFNDRSILYPYELDIYIPSKNLAIEFNGDYWHSDLFKDFDYHQNKTNNCAEKGIRLIHIFEYEWKNPEIKQKLINMLLNIKNSDKLSRIYARKCEIKLVNTEEAKGFINKFHLQGYSASTINVGLYSENTLVGIMTFGKPRFNNNFEYELIRLAYDSSVVVIGGTEKMFKYFIDNYNPNSVLTYCDISKFSGNTYEKLGFKSIENGLTKPNYVWINPVKNIVYKRYQTMKHKLISQGLGTEEQTENEIMHSQGFIKVYDCGNLKLMWEKESKTDG